jgi:hypothetical protein
MVELDRKRGKEKEKKGKKGGGERDQESLPKLSEHDGPIGRSRNDLYSVSNDKLKG